MFIVLTPLSASYEYSRDAKRVLRKLARETHALIERLGSKRNQYGDGLTTQDTCVVKIGSKVTKLDFWNSDLSFSTSFTYSSTLGFIDDLKILARGLAEVVKNRARVL